MVEALRAVAFEEAHDEHSASAHHPPEFGEDIPQFGRLAVDQREPGQDGAEIALEEAEVLMIHPVHGAEHPVHGAEHPVHGAEHPDVQVSHLGIALSDIDFRHGAQSRGLLAFGEAPRRGGDTPLQSPSARLQPEDRNLPAGVCCLVPVVGVSLVDPLGQFVQP